MPLSASVSIYSIYSIYLLYSVYSIYPLYCSFAMMVWSPVVFCPIFTQISVPRGR